MSELDPTTIVLSIIITWGIGLAPPLLIRYAFLRRPMGKWPAVGVCAIFWVFNVILFTALGSKSRSHFALTLVAFVSYWLLRKAGKLKVPSTTQSETQMPGGQASVPASKETAQKPLHALPATQASNDQTTVKGFISEQELAVIAKHDGIRDIIVQGHGIDPTLKPKFITHYLVRVNGRLLYRQAELRSGDNLEALAGWVGLNHGPMGKGPNTNPFEFESVEQITDTLSAVGITKFSVNSQIIWKKVHISFDV